MTIQHQLRTTFAHILLCVIIVMHTPVVANLTTLNNQDPIPMFEARDPQLYLLDREKAFLRGEPWANCMHDHASLSISVFGQSANNGKRINGRGFVVNDEDNIIDGVDTSLVPLGDIINRTSLLALFYGPTPEGQTVTPTLQAARDALFPGQTGVLNDPRFIDENQNFGFDSIEMQYRTKGLRLLLQALFHADFGLSVQTTVASKKQTLQRVVRRTLDSVTNFEGLNGTEVNDVLSEELNTILDDLDLKLTPDCPLTSIEEVRFNVFGRHIFELNECECDWPYLLIIPFGEVSGSISPGRKRDVNTVYDVTFGNNGHPALGFSLGIAFDFVETIELSGEVGYTYFFSRRVENLPVPTSEFQSNIFPFRTDVHVKPGTNWHFAGKIAAHHFVDKFSMFFQYFMMEHKEDTITLVTPNEVFLPDALAETTCFKVKVANIGITYDISQNTSLGFLWQAPLSQRNAYRSSTVLFSFNARF